MGEFRVLWAAHAQSRLGDQLARVAIAILVFEQTASALLTALTYALTFLPPLVSAPLLTGLADRYPRRRILVATDGCRAVLVAVMAIPALPVAAVAVLLVLVVSLQPLYSAARNAVLPNVLAGDRYVVGMGIVGVTDSVVQVSGFAFGGALVGLVGSHAALGVNAATFLLSASLAAVGLRPHRPAPAHRGTGTGTGAEGDSETGHGTPRRPSTRRSLTEGATLVWHDRRLRSLVGLLWLYGFYIAPEGIAAPYAAQLGAGTAAVGLLMAADPVGAGIGAGLLSRLVPPARRPRLIGPLAALAGVPLVLSALAPSLPLVVALWTLSGVLSSHTVLAGALFIRAVPDSHRGQTVGLVSAGLQTAQGLGVLAAGALASLLSPAAAVAVSGAAGTVCAVFVGAAWHRAHTAS